MRAGGNFRVRLGICLALAAVAAWLAGCGWGDEASTPTNPPPGSTRIGPDGGQVVADNGLAMVTIPAGALDQVLAVSVVPAADPPAGAVTGTAYDFLPLQTVFAVPCTVAIAFDPANLPEDAAQHDLHLVKASGGAWADLDTFFFHSSAYLDGPSSGLGTFGIVCDDPDTTVSHTAILTDDPDPQNPNEFPSLTQAMAYLEARLGYEDLGTLIWRTSTAQELDGLSFDFDWVVQVDEGYEPVITATSPGALVIDAAGAMDLSGFTINSTAGLVINTNRSLNLDGCQLSGSVSVNIGGVQHAPFPGGDPAYTAKNERAARVATGTTLNANTGMSGLAVEVGSSGTSSGDITVAANEVSSLRVGGAALLYPDVTLSVSGSSTVPTPYPIVENRLGGTSRVVISDFQQVQRLKTMVTVMGDNPVNISEVTGTTQEIVAQGPGTLTVNLARSTVDSTVARSTTDHNHFYLDQVNCQAGLRLEGSQTIGELVVGITGGSFEGGALIDLPTQGEPTVNVTEATFGSGTLTIGGVGQGGGGGGGGSGDGGGLRAGSVTLTDVTWSGAASDHIDISNLDAAVTITGGSFSHAGSPAVTLGLTEIGGAITITGVQLDGAGIGLVDCTGAAQISGAQIAVTSAAAYGLSLGGSAQVTVQDCTLSGASGGVGVLQVGDMAGSVTVTGSTLDGAQAAACAALGGSTVTLDDNTLITGSIFITDSQVHLAGNTFSAAMIMDDLVTPALLNDPVADNDGLLPDQVFTHMDWDGNGCCDYPPQWNVTDEFGNCTVCEGVAGKSRAWR